MPCAPIGARQLRPVMVRGGVLVLVRFRRTSRLICGAKSAGILALGVSNSQALPALMRTVGGGTLICSNKVGEVTHEVWFVLPERSARKAGG